MKLLALVAALGVLLLAVDSDRSPGTLPAIIDHSARDSTTGGEVEPASLECVTSGVSEASRHLVTEATAPPDHVEDAPVPSGETLDWIEKEEISPGEDLALRRSIAMSEYLEEYAEKPSRELAAEFTELRNRHRKDVRDAMKKRFESRRLSRVAKGSDLNLRDLPQEYDGSLVMVVEQSRHGHILLRIPFNSRPDLYEMEWRLESLRATLYPKSDSVDPTAASAHR